MDPADTLSSTPAALNILLDPGYHRREMGSALPSPATPASSA